MSSSSPTSNSGQKANKAGRRLEDTVLDCLTREGYGEIHDHKAQLFYQRKIISGKQYATQVVVGESIYGTIRKCDFMVFNREKFPNDLIIECKWQQAAGSVDEKFPFLYLNIQKTAIPTIVVLDGDGYKPGAKDWLKQQIEADGNLIEVYSLNEFMAAVNNDLL